jgi:hypothetical protein
MRHRAVRPNIYLPVVGSGLLRVIGSSFFAQHSLATLFLFL